MNPTLTPPHRVLIVDDHALVRAGYRHLLELESDILIEGECSSADEAYAFIQRHHDRLEVIILDLSLPGRSGLDLLRRLAMRWPRLAVLVCSMHDAPGMLSQALQAGARGFITKSSDPSQLPLAIRQVAAGLTVLSPDLQALGQTKGEPAPHERLSPREFQVMLMLARGDSVEAIAQALSLSAKRVANVQTLVRAKLGVGNAVELVHYVREHRLSSG